MYRILKIGMDVHSTNYTLCVAEPNLEGDPDILHEVEVEPDYRQILSVITKLRKKYKGDRLEVTCGYEAGCLGYSLYYQLTESGVKCVILAPSTMEMPGGKRIKTDKRDARLIAKCLANGGYSAVHIPSRNDEDVREFLRMREDVKGLQKTVKQRICSFCLRHGHKYCKSKWTEAHMKWLKELPLDDKQRETLTESASTNWHRPRNIWSQSKSFDALRASTRLRPFPWSSKPGTLSGLRRRACMPRTSGWSRGRPPARPA